MFRTLSVPRDLAKDVLYASELEDGTSCAASDNAGTRSSRLKKNATSTVLTDDLVRKRASFGQRNGEHVLLRILNALLDGGGHFLGLAHADTHAALAVTNDYQSGECETTTTLDNLGNAIDIDDTFLEVRERLPGFLAYEP